MLKIIAAYPLTTLALMTLATTTYILVQRLPQEPRGPVTVVDLWLPPRPPEVIEPLRPPLPPLVLEPLPVSKPVVIKPKSEVPHWVLKGIAKVETNSTIKPCGEIIWRDRRTGRHGDSGVFQMTRIAYRQIARPGDSFSRIKRDPEYAQELAERYLLYLRKRYTRWHDVIMAYNAGSPGSPAGRRYLRKVLSALEA